MSGTGHIIPGSILDIAYTPMESPRTTLFHSFMMPIRPRERSSGIPIQKRFLPGIRFTTVLDRGTMHRLSMSGTPQRIQLPAGMLSGRQSRQDDNL